MSWAISAILAKRLRREVQLDLLSLTAWQMLFGALVLAAIALVVPSRPVEWTGYFFVILAFNAFLGTAAGWLIWLYILHRLPAGTASLSVLAIPVVGVLSSKLQLGEQPGAYEIGGMLLIGASLALLSRISLGLKREADPEMGQE